MQIPFSGKANTSSSSGAPRRRSVLPEMADAATLSDIQEERLNHQRMRRWGDAQLRMHYGDNYVPPDYDETMRLNSPDTVSHNYPGNAGLGPWLFGAAALLALCGTSLGSLWMMRQAPEPTVTTPPAEVVNTTTTKGWIVEGGD